ncbi:MAG: ATP-binding protein [Sideroxyarcus sp.]|nr:ATP-binding protein [Sideroxyarcus sp.]
MRFATKIGLSAAAAALLIGPLIGAAAFFNARSLLLERIVHEQSQSATKVMESIDSALFDAYGDINMIAADNFLREFLESPVPNKRLADTVVDELEERAKLTGPWDGVAVFDRRGRVVFALTEMCGIGAQGDETLYRHAFESAMRGAAYHSDRVVCRSTGRPVVVFAAPIFSRTVSKKVVGVVVSHYIWVPVQKILDQADGSATIHLFDSKREVIGRRSGDLMAVNQVQLPGVNPAWKKLPGGEAGYAILSSSTHGGGATLAVDVQQTGAHGYRGNGWTLMMEMPLDVMFAPIAVMARNTGLLVFGVLLVTGALLVAFGRRFTQPLRELVEGVWQVEQGRLDYKVVVRSKDEFGELAESFNAMVDKLRAAQEELVRNEKLAVLGQVAGSVGHELRNPLGVMSNAVYFLQTVLSDADESVKEYLNIIKNEIAVSERMASDLMDAVRTRPPHSETVGIAELIEQTLRKCNMPPSVIVKLDIPATLPPLRVDAMQMHQVFSNLISNSVEAMPQGGMLEISAVQDNPGIITVSVRDSGIGMMPEQQSHLFQPLFTTKARGIGLGLVVVKNLTQANGGTVEVASEAGKGATFFVTLPCDSSTIESA